MPSALSLANRDDKSDQNWVLKVVAESVRPHKRQFSERVSRSRFLGCRPPAFLRVVSQHERSVPPPAESRIVVLRIFCFLPRRSTEFHAVVKKSRRGRRASYHFVITVMPIVENSPIRVRVAPASSILTVPVMSLPG